MPGCFFLSREEKQGHLVGKIGSEPAIFQHNAERLQVFFICFHCRHIKNIIVLSSGGQPVLRDLFDLRCETLPTIHCREAANYPLSTAASAAADTCNL